MNPYQSQNARIEKIIPETPGIKTFVLKPENPFPFRCGQFVELTVPGFGEAPFAPSSACFQSEQLELTVQNVGYMTSHLHRMTVGDTLGLRGPYGNGFPIEEFAGRDVLLVIGGVGFPPARALLLSLLNEKERFPRILMCYGARTPDDIVYKYQIDRFRNEIEMHLTVDKPDVHWKDSVGVVTRLLDQVRIRIPEAVAVVIGPPVMMKFGTLKLVEMGFPADRIYLSMERKMYCGIGQCRHCMIDRYFTCKDGPVFRYDTLHNLPDVWE